jgi:hypothetical protein
VDRQRNPLSGKEGKPHLISVDDVSLSRGHFTDEGGAIREAKTDCTRSDETKNRKAHLNYVILKAAG